MAGGIKITIAAYTAPFRKGLASIYSSVGSWSNRLAGRFARAGVSAGRRFVRGLTRTVRRGIIGAGALGAGLIAKSISEAGRFEKYDLQFEALLGTAEAAKKRMDEIKQVDLEAPFDITSITDASRVLTVFTNNAFAGAEALKMMADAASVTPNDIKDVAFWYGRAYSMIQSGRPFGEAAMRLQEMGLITGEARNEMERFSGIKNPRAIAQSLDILNSEFLKFQGSAAKLAKVWPGIMSIFTSASKQAFAAVGNEIIPLAKTWLVELIDKITELRKKGTLAEWGQSVSRSLESFRNKVELLIPRVKKKFAELKSSFEVGGISGLAESMGVDIEPAVESVVRKIGVAIEKYGPDFVNFGKEIGGSILKGIDNALDDAPWWLRTLTLDQFRELRQKSGDLGVGIAEAHIAKRDQKKRQMDFGRQILNAMNPAGDFRGKQYNAFAMQMAEKAYNNPEWAKELFKKPLPVEIINKKEDIP